MLAQVQSQDILLVIFPLLLYIDQLCPEDV